MSDSREVVIASTDRKVRRADIRRARGTITVAVDSRGILEWRAGEDRHADDVLALAAPYAVAEHLMCDVLPRLSEPVSRLRAVTLYGVEDGADHGDRHLEIRNSGFMATCTGFYAATASAPVEIPRAIRLEIMAHRIAGGTLLPVKAKRAKLLETLAPVEYIVEAILERMSSGAREVVTVEAIRDARSTTDTIRVSATVPIITWSHSMQRHELEATGDLLEIAGEEHYSEKAIRADLKLQAQAAASRYADEVQAVDDAALEIAMPMLREVAAQVSEERLEELIAPTPARTYRGVDIDAQLDALTKRTTVVMVGDPRADKAREHAAAIARADKAREDHRLEELASAADTARRALEASEHAATEARAAAALEKRNQRNADRRFARAHDKARAERMKAADAYRLERDAKREAAAALEAARVAAAGAGDPVAMSDVLAETRTRYVAAHREPVEVLEDAPAGATVNLSDIVAKVSAEYIAAHREPVEAVEVEAAQVSVALEDAPAASAVQASAGDPSIASLYWQARQAARERRAWSPTW